MTGLLQTMVLFGGTFAVIAVDRDRRPELQPQWVTVILLGVLLNFACLPYYFHTTRGGKGWLVGAGWAAACWGGSLAVGVMARLVFHH
jgi:hypothetical protein